MTVEKFGLTPRKRQVGPDEREDEDRDDRSDDAAAAAGQADAAEHDRGHAWQGVAHPGPACPIAGARGEGEAAEGRRTGR